MQKATSNRLKLKMITNRGVKVVPNGNPETYCTDHWRFRFVNQQVQLKNDTPQYLTINYSDVIDLFIGKITSL